MPVSFATSPSLESTVVTPENEDTPQALPEPPKKPIEPPSFDPIEPQEPQKSKGWLSTLATFLVVLLILVLGGVIVYLLSDLNSRHYRLSRAGDMMVVEKGKFIPTGFQAYRPKEPGLDRIYRPVPIPPGGDVPLGNVYEDRTDLDRAMFAILAGWARQSLQNEGNGATLAAETYIERCDLLPGVSEEQRLDIKTMRADLAYRRGRRLLDGVINQLKSAASQFERAIELGTSYATEATTWLAEVQARIKSLSDPAAEQEPAEETPQTPEKIEKSPNVETPDAKGGAPQGAAEAPSPSSEDKGNEPADTDIPL